MMVTGTENVFNNVLTSFEKTVPASVFTSKGFSVPRTFWEDHLSLPCQLRIVDAEGNTAGKCEIEEKGSTCYAHMREYIEDSGIRCKEKILVELLPGMRIRVSGGDDRAPREMGSTRRGSGVAEEEDEEADETGRDEDVGSGSRSDSESLEGVSILMGPPTVAAWSLCKVQAQGIFDGQTSRGEKIVKVTVPVEDTTARRHRRELVSMSISRSEAKLRAAAVAPGALVGAEIQKLFPGHGVFSGRVTGFSGKVRVFYSVKYEDGDEEDMSSAQVLEHLKRSMPHWTEFAPSWEANVAPAVEEEDTVDSDAEEDEEEDELLLLEVEEVEKLPTKLPTKRPREKLEPGAERQEKKRKKEEENFKKIEAAAMLAPKAADTPPPPAETPRKKKPAKSALAPAPAVEAAAGPSSGQAPVAPHSPAAAAAAAVEADSSSLQGIWKPCGAGHARGVKAYSKKEGKFLPIGSWIVEPAHHTLPGRFGVDHRHLERGTLATARLAGKNSVAGWIGVFAEGADPVDGRPVGPFHVGFYEKTQAKCIVLDHPQLETEEAAAHAYDCLALAYYGPAEADTNYPIDQAALAAMGQREDRAPRKVLTSAVMLLNLASGVDVPGVKEWRQRMLDTYVLRPPSAGSAPSLAVELAWLVEQAPAELLVPEVRDKGSRTTFIAECRSCTEPGARGHHYDADADSCQLCCSNLSTKATAHDKRTLCALIAKAATFFLLWAPGSTHRSSLAADRPRRSLASLTRGGAGAVGPLSAQELATLPKGLRVAVIGAGVAGLKAAAELQAAGAAVVVLEARQRVGGRIHTVHLKSSRVPRLGGFPAASAASGGSGGAAASAAVDVGAAFVLGIATDREPVNPVVPYLKNVVGAAVVPHHTQGTVRGALFFDENGNRVQPAHQLSAEAHFRELLLALHERESSARLDESVADAVRAVLGGMEFTSPVQRQLVECMAADIHPAPLDKLSLSGSMSQAYTGAQGLVQGGFNQLTNALAAGKREAVPQGEEPLPEAPIKDLRRGCQVRKVVLGADGAGVTIHTGATANEGGTPISVDAAVVTLPLGVLQAGTVEFVPPLPAFKQQAVAGLGSSNETRVALLFDKPFWPVAPQCLRPLSGDYSFLNLHALGTPNALCASVRPSGAKRIAAMSDKELVKDVMAALRRVFGGNSASATPVPDPLAFRVVQWGSDPFAGGAHSYVPFGASRELFDWMAMPVTGDAKFDAEVVSSTAGAAAQLRRDTRLFFAGEATHAAHPYSVHGAMESGVREAMRVLHWWKDHGAAEVERGGSVAKAAAGTQPQQQ